jgi:hypothetical protein
MSKYKAGLHKEVSAIFNGVSLPKSNGSQQSSATPAPAHQDYSAPKPPAPEPPTQKPPAPEPPTQKPPVPSHMTPTKPKPEQLPLQSPPKAVPAKQPKADTAIKAAGRQIPWQRTLEQIKSKLFAPKPGVSTTKQKMMVILAPVLFVVLIFVFIQAFSTPSRKITGPGTSGPVKAVAASDSKVDWQVPNPYPTTLRDPMQFGPVTTQTGQADTAGLIVKGIVYSKNNPCAVIGDQIVHQGDKVLGVVIIKINENNVGFEVNGKKWTQKVQR